MHAGSKELKFTYNMNIFILVEHLSAGSCRLKARRVVMMCGWGEKSCVFQGVSEQNWP